MSDRRFVLESPVGTLRLTLRADSDSLTELHILDEHEAAASEVLPPPSRELANALQRYFAGDLTAIDSIPVAPEGTPFQQKVWAALRTIRAGTTWTYAQLATSIGQPTATRAVGAANGRNPIGIVIPCHRVVATGGGLGGYAGGLPRKEWLLRHEGALPSSAKQSGFSFD